MQFQETIGIAAGLLTTFAFLPQVIKVHRRGSAEDLSYLMLIVQAAGNFLWFVYGLLIRSFPVVGANVVTLVLVLAILILKGRTASQQGPQNGDRHERR